MPRIPDVASLIRATRPCVARDGQNTRAVGQRTPRNIQLYRNSEMAHIRANLAQGRGTYRDRHERGPGGGGRRSRRREGFCRAGNCEQGRRAYDRCDLRTAKSCGPGARGLCAKSCGDVCCPTGRAHQPSARRRGNSASLPAGERDISRQTTAQGRPACPGFTSMPLCRFPDCEPRTVDRGCQPAPGLPHRR